MFYLAAVLIILVFFFVADFAHAGLVAAVLLSGFVVIALFVVLRRGNAKQND